MNDLNHRFHEVLYAYWDSLRGARLFPAENDLNPDDIAELWPSCFLISIDDVTRRLGYRYSYMGNELIQAYGDDGSQSDVVAKLMQTGPVSMKFDEVVQKKKPIIDESEFMNLRHLKIKYRTCMLPLGYDDKQVSHILGCMRWKVY